MRKQNPKPDEVIEVIVFLLLSAAIKLISAFNGNNKPIHTSGFVPKKALSK